jgi:hypothetical protein
MNFLASGCRATILNIAPCTHFHASSPSVLFVGIPSHARGRRFKSYTAHQRKPRHRRGFAFH